jgi:F0F1-type ATP synthase delta subunit
MRGISRRALARWATDELASGTPAAKVAGHLAAVLKDSNALNQAGFLMSDIAWELEHRNILAIGKITSATPISKQLESALKTQLKAATQARNVSLEKNIDKSVLGGVRVETASHIWDQTVSRKLSELREVF